MGLSRRSWKTVENVELGYRYPSSTKVSPKYVKQNNSSSYIKRLDYFIDIDKISTWATEQPAVWGLRHILKLFPIWAAWRLLHQKGADALTLTYETILILSPLADSLYIGMFLPLILICFIWGCRVIRSSASFLVFRSTMLMWNFLSLFLVRSLCAWKYGDFYERKGKCKCKKCCRY